VATFLLTWNPEAGGWSATEYDAVVEASAAGAPVRGRWGVGIRRSGIAAGDRAFLLRQRRERGIVASGWFESEIYAAPHWRGGARQPTTYADIVLDVLVAVRDRLPVPELQQVVPGVSWNYLQGSGVRAHAPSEEKLERAWTAHLRGLPGRRSRYGVAAR
jgi:hypothetical protein